MENLRRHLGFAVLMSELGHVFCCVLPTVFTILSFAANIGMIGMAPSWLMEIHAKIHHYELPIIIFSGLVLILGWMALAIGNKVNCRDTGCGHGACDTDKAKNSFIMIIATILFAANLFIFAVIHKNIFSLDIFSHGPTHVEEHHH